MPAARHWVFRLALWLGLSAVVPVARAHPAYMTAALARIERDGRYTVDLTFDALAFALNDSSDRVPDTAMTALLDGPRPELERRLSQARHRFEQHFRVVADGVALPMGSLRFPAAADVVAKAAKGEGPRLPVIASCQVTGQLPAKVANVAFQFPEVIGTVVLTLEGPNAEPAVQPVDPGEPSPAFALSLGRPADATVSAAAPARWAASLRTVGRFVRLGFLHIVPFGLDHVLFVLGLFLLGGRVSNLLWQVTAFTVAHSITLGLALYGVVRAPAAVVEPLIALSIVLVAVDNLRAPALRWWRVAVVFAFGLVHGMGFAGALRALDLPHPDFIPALIGFNGGVELGQLAVVAAAFLCVGWWRGVPQYRRWVVIPASTGIAAVALVWTIERVHAAGLH